MIYWITGRKNSGKTTLAKRLAQQVNGIILDGDDIRSIIEDDFTDEGRTRNQTRITGLAKILEKQGFNVIIACISPNYKLRRDLQATFKACIEIELPFGELWEGTEYDETPTR